MDGLPLPHTAEVQVLSSSSNFPMNEFLVNEQTQVQYFHLHLVFKFLNFHRNV
jgi:hypothetical protein